mgnify:CR=1 FL=1
MRAPREWPYIDYSRYRIAEAIVDRFRSGEKAGEIALDMLGVGEGAEHTFEAYVVELIVAAYDRRGMHRPARGWR